MPAGIGVGSLIKLVTGDLFSSAMPVLCNTVNCQGVMGKGIALAFKHRFPEMFKAYRARCQAGQVKPGEPYLEEGILLFPTKDHWRNPSQIQWIEKGLGILASNYPLWGIHGLALPPLGCGNGGLSFEDQVWPLMQKYLEPLSLPVEVYYSFASASEPELF